MVNVHIAERLSALRDKLLAMRNGGSTLSTASRGSEREIFVREVLENVIAPPFRITSGDITDTKGERSGQLDTVIEFSSSVSFPMTATGPRLFLAEGVCAVVEVKSNLSHQWSEVQYTFGNVDKLDRVHSAVMTFRNGGLSLTSGAEQSKIPVYAVGFSGWKTPETLLEKVSTLGLRGALLIEEEMFASAVTGQVVAGPRALFDFFAEISDLAAGMLGSTPDYASYFAVPPDAERVAEDG